MTERLVLRSEDRTASLSLAFSEAEAVTGAIAADVEVEAAAFCGAVPRVWFQRNALDAFEAALLQFERERGGSVAICNLGVADATNEFVLALEARAGGHAAATVSLLHVRYTRSGFAPLEITVRFDVDGGDLITFVRDWRRLFRMRAANDATEHP